MPEPHSHRESGQHVIEHALDLLEAADKAQDYPRRPTATPPPPPTR
nr:hypothetical protein [Pseudonocardia sp. AL041005-10]